MALNWSNIITGIAGIGCSVLALFHKRNGAVQSQDAVSNAYLQGGFFAGTSPTATVAVNPLLWIGLALLAIYLLFGRRRR